MKKILLILTSTFFLSCNGQEYVPLQKTDGLLVTVDVLLNDKVSMPFLVDTGCSITSIPDYVARTLIATKTLSPKDMQGSAGFILADGSKVQHYLVRLKTIKIGSTIFKDVTVCITGSGAPLLLGQNILDNSTIDLKNNTITFQK